MSKCVYVGVGSITYTELEYIQSTGTQYIDTGFVPNQDSEMELDFAVNAVDGTDNYLVGQRDTTTSKNFSFLVNAGGKFRFGYNTVVNDAGTADANRHTLKIEKNVLSMDGSEVVTATYAAFTGYGNMWICGINQTAGARYGKMKVYSCKLYDNGTLVRDFVPCQSSAGAIGLYDKVEGKFYANAGSGTFTAGTAGETIATTGIAQKVKKMYVGVGDVARKVKKGYIGIGGVARPFFAPDTKLTSYGKITSLSVARSYLKAAKVGNYALFGGGKTASTTYSAVVDAYNGSLTRTTATSLPTAIASHAATNVGNYALFGGGRTSSGVSTQVYAYDKSLALTTASSGFTNGCYYLAAGTNGSYAIFAGGRNNSETLYATAYCYTASLTRQSVSNLSVARELLAATKVGNYILFGGGKTTSYTTPKSPVVNAYDQALTRTTPTSFTYGRVEYAAASVGNKYALFYGGEFYDDGLESDKPCAYVEVYDQSLTHSTTYGVGAINPAGTSVEDYAIFGGGEHSAGDAEVRSYDQSLTATNQTDFNQSRHRLAATSVGGCALFGGGYSNVTSANQGWTSGFKSDVEAYKVV